MYLNPAEVLDRVYVDFKGPYSIDPDHPYALTILDDDSRFFNAIPVRSTKASIAIKGLERNWIQLFGPPKEIITDNGTFKSKEFKQFAKALNAIVELTAPYAHFQNAVQRKHRELDVKLRAFRHSQNLPWTEALHWAVLSINNATNAATSMAPSMLLYGRVYDPVTAGRIKNSQSLSIMRSQANKKAYKTRQDNLKKINAKTPPYAYKAGDIVYITNSWRTNKLDYYYLEQPLTFVRMKATNIAELRASQNQIIECHIDDIRQLCEATTAKTV